MKIYILIIAICYCASTNLIAQTVYIANNNPGAVGGPTVFTGGTALNDAMAAASNGDIIYVVPSPTGYGDPSITKQLTLFGGGFDPDKDSPELTYIGTTSVSILTSNVRLSGFTIAQISTVGAINNIMIDKCTVTRLTNSGGAAQGTIIIQNNILGQNIGLSQYVMNLGLVSSNIVISNNIIYNNQGSANGLIHTSDGTTVENNIFIGASSSTYNAFDNFNFGTVKNNIFYGVQPTSNGSGTFLGNVFEYNLSFEATNNIFPTTDGNSSANNLENVDPQFVNLPYGTTYSFSYDPTPGPAAIGTGEGGTDIGIFGGGSPFDVTGTPLPIVQVLDLPPTVSQGSDLPVNIKGRGN